MGAASRLSLAPWETYETQQALGRLIGWSVSTVSRFETAAERPVRPPTGATARCRQPRSCASGLWRPMRPCRRRRPSMPRRSGCRPRSGTVVRWTVLGSTSSSRPCTRSIRCCGCSAMRPSRCRCSPRRRHASSGRTSRPRSGRSTSRSRRPTCAAGATGSGATLGESGTSSGAWRTGTASSARSTRASGRTWTPGVNSPTTWRP
jgi:hypothetical protein